MFDKDKSMKPYGAPAVAITKQEAEKLELWCEDFRGMFGWKVNVTQENPIMVLEVIANRFNYRISAERNYLGCILNHKRDGSSYDLTDGDFDFNTFARILVDILYWESPLTRRGQLKTKRISGQRRFAMVANQRVGQVEGAFGSQDVAQLQA